MVTITMAGHVALPGPVYVRVEQEVHSQREHEIDFPGIVLEKGF